MMPPQQVEDAWGVHSRLEFWNCSGELHRMESYQYTFNSLVFNLFMARHSRME